MPEDPFLNYLALGILIFVIVTLFYGIIAIHDIPAKIAHARHHPHEDAIHAAGWVSLFTLHVLWPFLWIWAMSYQPERGWGFAHKQDEPTPATGAQAELDALKHRLAELEAKLETGYQPRLAGLDAALETGDPRRLAELEAASGMEGRS